MPANCPQQFSLLSPGVTYFFATCNIVVGFVAFFGNLLVFVLIWRTTSLRNRSICCLLSLAVTDFLVGMILEPMHVLQFLFQEFRENCMFNSIRRIFSVVLIGASISSIAFISYDRYIHLSKTQNYNRNMTPRKIAMLLFIVWLVPIFMPFLRLMGKDERAYGSFVFFYVLSNFVIMLVCYICIIKLVREKEKNMNRHIELGKCREARGTSYHVQAARVVTIIILCFFIATTPISISMGMSGLQLILSKAITGFSGRNGEIFYAFAMTSAMVNSAINPIIYYARNPGFKESLHELLPGRWSFVFRGSNVERGGEMTNSTADTDDIAYV